MGCNQIDNDLNIGRALELNSTLKELLLKKNELKDARAIAKTLEILDLKYNKIEVEGGAALQGSLIINRVVTLDLMYNKFIIVAEPKEWKKGPLSKRMLVPTHRDERIIYC